MSELSFDQMLEGTLRTIHNGEIVDGTVISVKEDEIILNIGYKSDGIIKRIEYTNDPTLDLTTVVSPGDTMTVKILKVNDGEGQVMLTYKRLVVEKINKELEDAFENNEVLTGTVAQIMSGGLNVDAMGTKVFIPASLVSDMFERDLSKYLDKEVEFRIIEFNPRKRRIIGDRKNLIIERKEERKAAALEKLSVGMVIEGKIKNVTDFGAFIDLDGIDGLLHISEMSWGRIGNPKKVFKNGDVVKVYVKDINEDKIALSAKFDDNNPWNEASTKYAIGNIVKGTVARMTDFGAFVELEPGVDALLHVSQISLVRIEKPSDALKVGQEIEAKVVGFNSEEHKISLSVKVLLLAEKAKADEEAKAAAEAEGEEAESVYITSDDEPEAKTIDVEVAADEPVAEAEQEPETADEEETAAEPEETAEEASEEPEEVAEAVEAEEEETVVAEQEAEEAAVEEPEADEPEEAVETEEKVEAEETVETETETEADKAE